MVEIPSKDTYVRIESKRTGKVLADDEELYHADKDPIKSEHWWKIIPVDGQSERYIIKNVTTGRVIWCRDKNRRAGAIDSDGKWADNWFTFEETKGPGMSGTFRIRCPSTNCVLVSRSDKKPEVDGYHLDDDNTPDYEDQHFLFNLEDSEVDSIEYDLGAAKRSGTKPSAIADQDLENLTPTEQIQTFTYNEDKAEEHTLEHTHGFEVSASQKIKIGSWPIWAGEFEVKVSQKNEWKIGTKNTITTKWGISQALKVPANSVYTATLTATQMSLTVPYKMTWIAKDSGAKNISYGVYTGVAYYGASCSIKPKDGSATNNAAENRSFEDGAEGEIEQEGYGRPYGDATVEQSYNNQEFSQNFQSYDDNVEREENYSTQQEQPYDGENENYDNGAEQRETENVVPEQEYDGEGQSYDNGGEQEEGNIVEPEPPYDVQESFQQGQNRIYSDNAEQEEGNFAENEFVQENPYQDGYSNEVDRQSYEEQPEQQEVVSQRDEYGQSYNTGNQQNEYAEVKATPYEPEQQEVASEGEQYGQSYNTGYQQNESEEVEGTSYQPNQDEVAQQYTAEQNSYENSNNYEERRYNEGSW